MASMEPEVPIFGTIGLWFFSREPDTNGPVIQAIYWTWSTGVLKIPTVIDRGWETGRTAIFKIINQKPSWRFVMPHETKRHGRTHDFNWKRLFPTMRTCLNCKSK